MEMGRFKMKRIQLYLLLILGLIGCQKDSYVKYEPISVMQKNGKFIFVKKPLLATKKHLSNIKFLLNCYGYDYKETKDGEILISTELKRDKEMLYNLTKKANDNLFMSEFKKCNAEFNNR